MLYRRLRLTLPLVVLLLAGCATEPSAQSHPAQSATASQTTPPAVEAAHDSGSGRPEAASAGSIDGHNAAGFQRWVAGFRQRAAARGVSQTTLERAFGKAEFLPRIIELDNRQPEFNRAIWDYLDTAVSDTRVAHGRDKLSAYGGIANRDTAQYGVPAAVLMAIWGIESNYGGNFGNYETIDALATLGYDGRRQTFAENQLYAAMKILDNGDIARPDMRGSWAGAMGNTQFLPTSFLSYAVDADGDDRRDIWGSIPDTLASTANYLAKNGWQAGQPWGREVALPAHFDYAQADGDTKRSTAVWRTAGVRAVDSRGLPEFESAAIIAPAGASGPAFMVGPNFRVILRYNNATSYALAVGLLADRIVGKPAVQQSWPRHEARLSRGDVRTLQRDLNTLGFGTGTPDGIVGPNTRSGLRAFQRAHGLTADGFPTERLLNKVAAAASD
ncbi:lytic murein transglycosylase [Salinisphaera sp. SPP-AMP-43]|uniref:lytic murein transglycosylase n=1 Tax=Salinisphaera sp. SPP-AMP-43 TaxID=3121288 RepID=UPI003C6E66B7